jgi:hypothetical protein
MLVHFEQIAPGAGMRPFCPLLGEAKYHCPQPRRQTAASAHSGGGERQEGPDQVILHRHDSLATARITLPPATTIQLAVDALGIVQFGQDDVQPTTIGHTRSKLDIRSAARHVGSDSDTTRFARAGNDLGFVLILSRVEQTIREFGAVEQARQMFGSGN